MLARGKSRPILAEVAQTLFDYLGHFIKPPNFGPKYDAEERKRLPGSVQFMTLKSRPSGKKSSLPVALLKNVYLYSRAHKTLCANVKILPFTTPVCASARKELQFLGRLHFELFSRLISE